jgi:2-polyprenyl-6-methoxyphenol hydroxylase-like FAD-dependent oxidoreductase
MPQTSAPSALGSSRIAVIGHSLTGPTAALLLHAAGFDQTRVYEAAPSTATLGGGLISLEHPALDILDRLGIEHHEYLAGPSQHIDQITVHHRRPTATTRRAYPGRFTTWTLLNQALNRHSHPGTVHTGHRLTALTAPHGGAPLLTFANGETTHADLIVFCDGRNSTGRRLLDPTRRLHYAGYVAHRASAPTTGGIRDFLRFQPGPGVQFNIAPIPGGADWTFYLNATPDQYAAHFGAPPHQRGFALPHHVSPAARDHVNHHATVHLPPEQAALVPISATRMAVPVMDIDPPTRMVWPIGTGHAVLLGDALAPVRPHTARGANNGIEQAAALTAALIQHHRHDADLAGALNRWQRRQLITALAAVRLGPTIGDRLHLGTPTPRPATSVIS